MNSRILLSSVIICCFLVFGYFLIEIQSVIIYIIIAAILSLIARPLILVFKKKLKLPNTIAVVLTMFLMLSLILGLIGMFIPLIAEQGESLSLLEVDQLQVNIQNVFNQITDYFAAKGIDVLSELKNVDFISQFKEIPNVLNGVLSALGSLSIGLFSVLFISFFFMKDSKLLKNGVMTFIPTNSESRFSKSLETINNLLSRYFIGLLVQITILFVLYCFILWILGISNVIVIAFLCALLNLIPYVGPIIGATIMFLLSMTSNISQDFQSVILPTSLWVLFWYFMAQIIDNFISQPLIFSKTTKSHPLEIFLVIIIGGLLFGITGMITAVPLYTVLKVILKEFLADNKIVKSLTKDL